MRRFSDFFRYVKIKSLFCRIGKGCVGYRVIIRK